MRTFICEKEMKLSRFLLKKYEGELSFSALNKLLRKKDVKLNGRRVSKDTPLSVGDRVEVYFDGAAIKADYETIYEDDNVLITVKPKGITSENFFTLLKKEKNDLYFCHRLDRNTDGIMAFAKNEGAYSELLNGFKKRTFKKNYYALVNGIFGSKSGSLTAYLYKEAEKSTVKVYDREIKGAKKIVTAYKVLSEDKEKDISFLDVHLVTGRTHQIRAHLAHVGHFILGDDKYGDRRVSEKNGISSLALSAYCLELKFDSGEKLYYLNGKKFVYKSALFDKIEGK